MRDTQEQLRQARIGGVFRKLDELGAILVDGPDAAVFLHNTLTADVKRLAVGTGTPSFQASPRGEALALLTVLRTGETRYLLVNDRQDCPRLLEAIEKLHFSEKFAASDVSAKLNLIAVQGPATRQVLAAIGGSAAGDSFDALAPYGSAPTKLAGADVRLAKLSLCGGGALLIVGESDSAKVLDGIRATADRLGLVEADADLFELLQIEAGLPKLGRDLPKAGLASELGITHPAFSYDKGCFVGQEIIARIRTKGSTPIRVMGLMIQGGGPVAAGTELRGDDDSIGAEVTASVESPAFGQTVAIARVRKAWQIVGAKLKLPDGRAAEVSELPFVLPEPEKRASLYDEALLMFAQDREADALDLLKRELDQHPDNIDAWEALGVIHDRAGRYRDAVAAMKQIVDRDPKHLMANVNLSMYHMKLGDKATAEDFQARATNISLERRMAEARAKGEATGDAELEKLQKLEQRLGKFMQIIEMDPGDVLGHFGAGKACLDLRRFGEAVGHFDRVLEIQPDYSVAWANLGQALVALGNLDRAREVFGRGIEVARGKGDLMPMRDMQTRLEKLPEAANRA